MMLNRMAMPVMSEEVVFSAPSSRVMKTGECALAAREGFGFDAHLLENREEEAAEGLVVAGVEGEVLAVFETTSGEEDGEVVAVVHVGIAHVAAIKDHG